MDASCGPSNALQTLSKHTQRDNSLQNDLMNQNRTPADQQQFRSNSYQVDQNLNRDFQQFNGQNNAFSNGFLAQYLRPMSNAPVNVQNRAQQGWVGDFSKMSISQQPQGHQGHASIQSHQNHQAHQTHQGQHQTGWHQQFMAQKQPQAPHMSQDHSMAPNYTNAFSLNMRTNLSMPMYNQQHLIPPTEHKQVHALEQEQQKFDDHFEQLEKELAAQQPEYQIGDQHPAEFHIDNSEFEKQQFADAAKQVHDSMLASQQSSETSEKFQQSGFLKLMGSIKDRSVELSHQGDKLVDSTSGQDIRTHLPDPLREARIETPITNQEPDYHRPVHQEPAMQQVPRQPVAADNSDIRSHLPDPLAHIKDGELGDVSEPLQAARIISGNQVRTSDWMEGDWMDFSAPAEPARQRKRNNIMDDAWQEVYDDYRHDDDSH